MFSAHARTARKPTTHTHTQFDPNSEVYVQTEFPEDEYAAAEAARQQDEASTVSEDFLRQMDGKGSGGPRAPRRPTGPDGRSTNTGVKGVQADYAAAKLKLRARRLEAKLYAERALNRASVGADRSEVTVAEAPPMPRQKPADELDSDFDSDEDGGAFEAYKLQRMRALQAQQQQADAPFWGKLEEATVQNFIEEVEDAAGSHFIVVHLYQPYVEECVRVNFALMTLAERFPRIRFMRGVCTDLIPSFDEIGLPTLMLYRGGKQLDILVRITDELGPNFADRDLVFYLNKYAL